VYFLRFPDTGTSSPQDQQSRDQMSTTRGQPQIFVTAARRRFTWFDDKAEVPTG